MDSLLELSTARQTTLKIDYQEKSLLFRLPQELRNMIFSHLFQSTRVSWGTRKAEESVSLVGRIMVRPAPNALAIIRSCRRAKDEIGEIWLGQIVFSFESPEAMLNKLAVIHPSVLSKIRRLRVFVGGLLRVYPGWGEACYRLAAVLRLLPGLCLDTLTVLGYFDTENLYDILTGLIREGSGWKELRFISHSSDLLGFPRPDIAWASDQGWKKYRWWRQPQPSFWQFILNGRDGPLSKPSVDIYRSTVACSPGSVLDDKTRMQFEQRLPDDIEACEGFGIKEDAKLMVDGEKSKEIMIIVKRGTGVDYEQKQNSHFIDLDFSQHFPGKKWPQVRGESLGRLYFKLEDEAPIAIDTYENVDQYTWPYFEPRRAWGGTGGFGGRGRGRGGGRGRGRGTGRGRGG